MTVYAPGKLLGPQGAQGAQGAQGTQGPSGAQGAQGAQGTQGTQGAQGFQGSTGSGSQGSQGSQGAQGNQGTQGSQGNQGTQGAQGAQGGALGNFAGQNAGPCPNGTTTVATTPSLAIGTWLINATLVLSPATTATLGSTIQFGATTGTATATIDGGYDSYWDVTDTGAVHNAWLSLAIACRVTVTVAGTVTLKVINTDGNSFNVNAASGWTAQRVA